MLLERLIENLDLRVEAFATCRVATGWRLRLPGLDWTTFHYVVRGRGSVLDGAGHEVPLPAASLAIVPPHLVHVLQCGVSPFSEKGPGHGPHAARDLPEHAAGPERAGEQLVVVCGRVHATYGGALGLFEQLGEVLVLDYSGDATMKALFEGLLEEARSDAPASRAMASSLMQSCLIRVLRRLCREECTLSWLTALDDPDLAPALEAMVAHPEHPHTVATLASRVFLSRSAFSRRFSEAFGRPPLTYLREVRLRHAARLLRQDPPVPVATVARRSGFSSRSQFSRAFREQFGEPPSAYRD